jgi:tetratricopeptide (TPR) repeat protein
MSNDLRKQIYGSLNPKETDELIKIWQTNNHVEWTEIAFDVIREILQERHVELPPQDKPVLEAKEVIDLYQNALVSARKNNDREKEACTLANLGEVYLINREVERAIGWYEQALALFRQIGNRAEETSILINLGTSNLLLGQFRRSLDYEDQALAICREMGNRSKEGVILEIIGRIYNVTRQVDKAIEITQSAVKIYDEIGDPRAESAREQLNHFSAKKSKKNLYLIIVPIGLFIILIAAIFSSVKKNLNSSNSITTPELKEYISMNELYSNTPSNSTDQKIWDQWENQYQGKYVKGKGKLVEVRIYPQESKLFLIVTILGEEATIENNPTRVALLVEDAHNIRFGEKEGSFVIDSVIWIYLGENYAFEGRVSGFSLFDPELVSEYRDLIIVKVKMLDFREE